MDNKSFCCGKAYHKVVDSARALTKSTGLVASLALSLLSGGLNAETIYSDFADLSLKFDRTTNANAGSNGPGESQLNVGKSGAGAGFDRAAVVVFQLPDLGNVVDPFGSATFGAYLVQASETSANGDLYGLGRRESPDVQDDDYYGRDNIPDPTDATLIQDNYLTPTGLVLNSLVNTSTTGSQALADYLNAQYEGGVGIGQYVFLRVNVDTDTTQRYSFTSTDGAAGNLSQTPQINYLLAGAPVDTIRVESTVDGSGSIIPAQTLTAGDTLTTFAIARDGAGAFLENTAVTWSLENITGQVTSEDLVVSQDSMSATFNATGPGTAEISIFGNAANLIGSGTLTVEAGPATQVTIDTAPDGFGEPVEAQLLIAGNQLLVYAVSRDAVGNPLGGVSAEWSLENIMGDIVPADLVAGGDGTSAILTAALSGEAVIRATSDGLTSVDSGLIRVSELVSLWTGSGGNSSWNNPENWLAQTLPLSGNTADLIFHDPDITRLSLYLGVDWTARSLSFNEDANQNVNIRLTQNGTTGAASLILDTDSVTDPAEIIIDANSTGNLRLGNIALNTDNEYGSIVLIDDLRVTHNGTGILTIDGGITEGDSPRDISFDGSGNVALVGTNAYSGSTTVNAGVLTIDRGNALSDTGALIVGDGLVEILTDETVGNLFINGLRKSPGVYGSSLSAAPVENQDDVNFSGSGTITSLGFSDGIPNITEITRSGDQVTLTWSSSPGESFALFFSTDLINFDQELEDGIPAEAAGGLTSYDFPVGILGAEIEKAFFRVKRK